MNAGPPHQPDDSLAADPAGGRQDGGRDLSRRGRSPGRLYVLDTQAEEWLGAAATDDAAQGARRRDPVLTTVQEAELSADRIRRDIFRDSDQALLAHAHLSREAALHFLT